MLPAQGHPNRRTVVPLQAPHGYFGCDWARNSGDLSPFMALVSGLSKGQHRLLASGSGKSHQCVSPIFYMPNCCNVLILLVGVTSSNVSDCHDLAGLFAMIVVSYTH